MPFAGYTDFDSCTRANADKRDPAAYCAAIKRQIEGKAHAGVRFGNVGGDPFQDQDTLEEFLDALNEVADEVYIGDTEWPSDDYSIHDRPVEVVGAELDEVKEIWNEFAEDAVALGGPQLIDEDRKALPEPTHIEDSKLNEAELFGLTQKADEWTMEKGVWVNSETGDVVYDHRLMGAEPKQQPEGSNPGGNAPETGKQDPEQKAFGVDIYEVIGGDDMDGKLIGVGVDMPNDDLYVDWKNDEWPDDQQLDDTHVSIYGSVDDLVQATGNEVNLVETVELESSDTASKSSDTATGGDDPDDPSESGEGDDDASQKSASERVADGETVEWL